MNSLVKNVFFPLAMWKNGYRALYNHLEKLEESQFWPLSKIKDMQMLRLSRLLNHAYQHTEFYRKRFDEHGFNPGRFQSLDDLRFLPILTKDDILSSVEKIKAKNLVEKELIGSLSGGTTGRVTPFYLNKSCLSAKLAAVLRFDKWTGWDIGEWYGLVWPATVDHYGKATWRGKVMNFLADRKIKLELTIIEEDAVRNFISAAALRRITMIRGFPMPFAEVAKIVLERGLPAIHLKGAVTTGEMLYSNQRTAIENAFQCRVFDSYRTRENGPLAQECEFHQGMHINAESVFLEAVPAAETNSGDVQSASQAGKILVTDLLNYGMPFIRYAIGDIGTLSARQCPCGRGLPIMEEVGGRLVDLVYAPDGRPVASITLIPNLFHTLGITNRGQIVQDALDHIIIKIEKPALPKEILERQKQIAGQIFGPAIKVTHEFVDNIPKLKSGKYAFIVCNIPADKRGRP